MKCLNLDLSEKIWPACVLCKILVYRYYGENKIRASEGFFVDLLAHLELLSQESSHSSTFAAFS